MMRSIPSQLNRLNEIRSRSFKVSLLNICFDETQQKVGRHIFSNSFQAILLIPRTLISIKENLVESI